MSLSLALLLLPDIDDPADDPQPDRSAPLHYGDAVPPSQYIGDPETWRVEKPRVAAAPQSPRYLFLMGQLVEHEHAAAQLREELQRLVLREALDAIPL